MTYKKRDTCCGKKPPGGWVTLQARCGLTLLLALIFVSCACLQSKGTTTCISQNNIEDNGQYPDGQLGSILLVDDPIQAQPMQQVFVAEFLFIGYKVESQELRIVSGTGKVPRSLKCDFQFEMVDAEDNLLARYGIWDPRIVIADEDEKKEFEKVPNATFVARFPFTAKAKEIRVLNAQKKIVAGRDVRAAIKKFCEKNKDHPACRSDPVLK